MIPTSYTQANLINAPLPAPAPAFHPPYDAAVVAPTVSQKSLDSEGGFGPHSLADGPGQESGQVSGPGGGGIALLAPFPRTISPARASLTQLGAMVYPSPPHPTCYLPLTCYYLPHTPS